MQEIKAPSRRKDSGRDQFKRLKKGGFLIEPAKVGNTNTSGYNRWAKRQNNGREFKQRQLMETEEGFQEGRKMLKITRVK